MSLSEIDKKRHTDQPAEQTGDFLAHNTAGDGTASVDTSKHPPMADPLLALLRPSQADCEVGRLAHFAITRLLGRGGMGAVFAADDLLLHRKVALKVMRPELTARPEARERFLREARTAGGLDHDHIIAVHEVAEDNGVWFIVMPLLKGEPLDARLTREGRLSIKAVLKLGRETAEGLAAAHEKGLVHRDIKPANLWLEGTGDAGGLGFRRVKILDFGLARAVQDDQHLTAEGGLLGTPAYMAPEQAAGEEVDHRADLFNLGAVLYRCCAGEPPFSGKTTAAVTTALMTKNAVPVGHKNPNLPAALAKLIMHLLDKTPAGRPQTAAQVAGSLRRIEREQTPDKSKADSALGTGTAATGLFMGSLAFVFSFSPFFGWFIAALLAIFGIIFSGFALVRALKIKRGQSKAIAGILTSVLAVLWWPLFTVQTVRTPSGAHLAVKSVPTPRGTLQEEFVNSLGMRLKLIQPGTFLMGLPNGEPGAYEDEHPPHTVEITRPFYLGVYPVTQAEYVQATGLANPSWFSNEGGGKWLVQGLDTAKFPVEQVSWDDAAAFCEALNRKDAKRPAGWKYALPTEAEWEYACRAGTTTSYFFGSPEYASSYAWYSGNAGGRTHAVGTRAANPWGLFDINGNVYQWCADAYDKEYYANSPIKDPQCKVINPSRVLRGGSWSDSVGSCRATYRNGDAPSARINDCGIRVCCHPPE